MLGSLDDLDLFKAAILVILAWDNTPLRQNNPDLEKAIEDLRETVKE